MKFWIIHAIVFALFTALAQVNCNFLIMFHGSISPEALSRLFKIIEFILPLWFGQFKAHPYALAHTSWPYDFFLGGNWHIQNSHACAMKKSKQQVPTLGIALSYIL